MVSLKANSSSKIVFSIVLFVAVIAIFSLVFGGNDFVGYASAATTCTDTDGGFDYLTQGTISGGTWKTTGKTYADKIDSCNAKGQLQEGFCPDSTHGFYIFKYCDKVVGVGYRCIDGACVLDSDADGVTDSADVCVGFNDNADEDSDGIPDGCDYLDDTYSSYELCNDDLYLGVNISFCEGDAITGTDFGLLKNETYQDNKGSNKKNVSYSQTLLFQEQTTGQFIFTQDDDDAPVAMPYIFIDNGNAFIYNYSLFFNTTISFNTTSDAAGKADFINTTIEIQGKKFNITDVNFSSGVINELTLQDWDGNTIVIINNNELLQNGADVDNAYALIYSGVGTLKGFSVAYAPDTDEAYLQESTGSTSGASYFVEDPSFNRFKINFTKIENNENETIEFVAGSTSAELRFTNNDGRGVEIPIAADSSYTAGEASNEPIFWGNEAPTSTVWNQDELVYLEGETCTGPASVVDCQGAMFVVIDADKNAHLIQITNVDTVDNKINFDDLTYGTTNDNMPYADGSVTDISLTSAGDIQIEINESARTVIFTTLGSDDGAQITTLNNATLEIINTNTSTQIYEGIRFYEYNDGTRTANKYLVENYGPLNITAIYDDVTDNSIEWNSTTVTALGYSQGFGLFDTSDVDDTIQKFMTYKGTLLTFDREDQQSLVIEHPAKPVYATVLLESLEE